MWRGVDIMEMLMVPLYSHAHNVSGTHHSNMMKVCMCMCMCMCVCSMCVCVFSMGVRIIMSARSAEIVCVCVCLSVCLSVCVK